jgi:hypothetical protein
MGSLGFRFAYRGHGKTMDAAANRETSEAPPASLCAAIVRSFQSVRTYKKRISQIGTSAGMSIDVGQLELNGFVFARGVRETDLIGIVQHLGNVRFDPRSPMPVRDISPQLPSSAKANTLSSRYGTDAFPFHTDTAHWDHPAKYLALFCVNPGEGAQPL